MRVTGINHVTLAVSEVDRSLTFYRDLLGFQVRAVWPKGAYLEAGSLWLCLSLDEQTRSAPHPDYSHIAFTVDEADFLHLSDRLITDGRVWKQDSSEGASLYFLDPDGHKLEIHVGSLQSRLRYYRENPSKGVRVFDN